MRWRRAALLAALTMAGGALALGACGSARRGEPLRGPLSLDEPAERGRLVFLASCHACHPGGEGGLGPALNNKPLPGFLKRFQVRHGLGVMPSFRSDELSDAQLADLMAYLGRLRKHERSAAKRAPSGPGSP
jgi:mono/diheme cytochrome c family protein